MKVDVESCVDVVYLVCDVGVMIVLGLFVIDGMVIVFCLMKMFVSVVYGLFDNLIMCVVDVMLKECCCFVLMVCEMFFNFVYLCNMIVVIEMGGIVFLLLLVFYVMLKMIEEFVD